MSTAQAICVMCDKPLHDYDGALLHEGKNYWCEGASASVATPAPVTEEGDKE